MYRRINYITIGLCCGIFYLKNTNAQAQSLTFTDAYNKMYQENNTLKAINEQGQTQHYISKSLKGLRFPSVNAYATGMVFDRRFDLSFNDFRNGLASHLNISNPSLLGDWEVPVGKKEMFFAGFNALWPIFTGGKISAAVKAGEIENEIVRKDIENTENQLISELAQRYFQVKLADEALVVRKQVLEGMNKHLYNATKLEENGIIPASEKLVADVAVSEANREVLSAEKNTKLARTALANTLDADQISDKLTSPFVTNITLFSLESYKEAALKNYPELQKVMLQKNLADQGVKAKKSMFFPDIALFGQTTLLHNDPLGFGILEHSNQRPWVVGVGVTYNIFSGMKNRNELKAAISTRKTIDFLEAKAQKDVTTFVENLYFEVQKSQEEIVNLEVQEKLATELVRARNKAFAEGLATSTNVVDAENALSLVKLLILNAKYLNIISFAGLLEFTGQSKDFLKYTN